MARWVVVALAAAGAPAHGGEFPTEPTLRIESATHRGDVTSLAADAAGRFLVTGSVDKTARVWDASSGRLLQTLRPPIGPGAEGQILAVAMSPDGSLVAAGGATGERWDGSVSAYLFDRTTGRMVRRITGLPGRVKCLVFSRDGARLLLGMEKEGFRVVLTATGEDVSPAGHQGFTTWSADYAPDGRIAVSDGIRLRLYDGSAAPRTVPLKGNLLTKETRFAPDGRLAVSAEKNLFVLANGTLEVVSQRSLGYSPRGLSWSTYGDTLYSGDWDIRKKTTIHGWSVGSRRELELPVSSATVDRVIALPSGKVAFADPTDWGVTADGGQKWVDSIERETLHDKVRINASGQVVGANGWRFSVARRSFVPEAPNDPLYESYRAAPGLDIKLNGPSATCNAAPLDLEGIAQGFAVSPLEGVAILGTTTALYAYDRQCHRRWRTELPGPVRGEYGNNYRVINVSGDGRVAVAALEDGTFRWYRVSDGEELLALYVDGGDRWVQLLPADWGSGPRWVLFTPAGYYDASPGAEELLGWNVNQRADQESRAYPASAFRETYYRPDIVSRVLVTLDVGKAIAAAPAPPAPAPKPREAAAAPVAAVTSPPAEPKSVPSPSPQFKLHPQSGLLVGKDDFFSKAPPRVELLSPEGEYRYDREPSLKVTIQLESQIPVAEIIVQINGEVRQGIKEIRRTRKEGDDVRVLAVPIRPGDRRLAVQARTNVSAMSAPDQASLVLKYVGDTTPAPRDIGLHLLAVGYNGNGLRYAEADATEIAKRFDAQKGRGLFSRVDVTVLISSKVIRKEIMSAMDALVRKVAEGDYAILFFSGHGEPDESDAYRFLPQGMTDENKSYESITAHDILSRLDLIKKRGGKAILLLDTCYAGNIAEQVKDADPARTGIEKLVHEALAKGSGKAIITASAKDQKAREREEWGHGAFTKAVLDWFDGGWKNTDGRQMTIPGLVAYAAKAVEELTNHAQWVTGGPDPGLGDFPLAAP